ncbi:MAG: hypothetical protein RSB70_00205 [Clostridium sp.]
MSKCLFLSTAEETVQCFNECEFYNYIDGDGVCPFTQMKTSPNYNNADLEKYDFSAKDKESLFKGKHRFNT